MIAGLVRLLTGGTILGAAGPWLAAGVVVAIAGGGFWAGDSFRAMRDAVPLAQQEAKTAKAEAREQACKATHERGRADGAEKALTALGLSVANVTSALETLGQKAAARGKSLDQFLKEIANAPPSHLCGSSAPELAYRRSVQREPAVPAAAP